MPPKTRAQLQEEYRTTKPCRFCGMNLVNSANTFGHSQAVCDAHKAKLAKEAAVKAKKAASKPKKN